MQQLVYVSILNIDRLITAEAGQYLYLLTRKYWMCNQSCDIFLLIVHEIVLFYLIPNINVILYVLLFSEILKTSTKANC